MISVKELSKHYGAVAAVDAVTFDVNAREVMGFLGPNGAGKTTTLRMLACCLAPTSGTAQVGGSDILESSLEVRRRIGYLPENNPLYEDMDPAEYLEWTAAVRGLAGARRTARIRDTVEECSLGEVLTKPVGLLSKGYRQRLGLAAAILHDPDILLLDEPTSGLDPNQTREVRGLIQRLKEAKTVLLSTHILREVEASCDRIVILHRGKIAATGTPQEIARRSAGESRLHLTLKSLGVDPESVRKALRGLPGVAGAQAEVGDGEIRAVIEAKPDAGDMREPLFRLAVERNWALLELRQEEASLESVFRDLTPAAPERTEQPPEAPPQEPEEGK